MRIFRNGFLVLLPLLLLSFSVGTQARRHRSSEWVQESQNLWAEATTPKPVDEEVCFAPDEACEIKVEKLVESAQKSIDVAIYDLNLEKLTHDLLVAGKKIPVRIVVDRRQAKERNSLVPTLIQAGAQLRFGHQRGIMHNKFVIVDSSFVETGSFNFTHHASRANNENQIYLAKAGVVKRFKERFEKIWSEADAPDKNFDYGPNKGEVEFPPFLKSR